MHLTDYRPLIVWFKINFFRNQISQEYYQSVK